MQIIISFLSACLLVVFSNQGLWAQESRFTSLLEQTEAVSDDALHIPPAAASALVGQNCEVSVAEKEAFNALLPLNSADKNAAKKRHAPWGIPVAATAQPREEILHHNEYIINHNGDLKLPTYASYQLDRSEVVSRTRVNCFRKDIRLDDANSSTLDDYDEPVFDRGHLVPRADMNRSQSAMINTFVLSNMMPQHDQFNRGVWRKFESTIRAWAKLKGSVHVVTGAVFDKETPLGERDKDEDADRVRPLKQLAIPTHFYKIVLHQKISGYIEAIAILLPHTDNEFPMSKEPWEKLAYMEDNITSIDEIEAVTGYDFFPEMPDAQEVAVERSIASGLWQ